MIKMFRPFGMPSDPFNWLNERNISNTKRRKYNCAGYALETFSWYCPHENGNWHYDYSFDTEEEAWQKTMYSVNTMVKDFRGKLRMIETIDQLDKKTERVVAFRLSSWGDFHYVKKGANGHWYHKKGSSRHIDTMTQEEAIHGYMWCNDYDGPIVLLAIKK